MHVKLTIIKHVSKHNGKGIHIYMKIKRTVYLNYPCMIMHELINSHLCTGSVLEVVVLLSCGAARASFLGSEQHCHGDTVVVVSSVFEP